MRILRNLLWIFAVVVGVVLASSNMEPVRFVYLPGLTAFGGPESADAQIPLALLLLAFLLAGAFVAGTGTFVEHVRLRFVARRNEKVVKAVRTELEKTRSELDAARDEIAAKTAENLTEQARARRAEEAEARALEACEQERARADEAARAPAAPPA